MKKLFLLLLLITMSCTKEDDDIVKTCECIESIYEYNVQTDVNGNEFNAGNFIEEKETTCKPETNTVVQNNDYPNINNELLYIVVRCQ